MAFETHRSASLLERRLQEANRQLKQQKEAILDAQMAMAEIYEAAVIENGAGENQQNSDK